MLYASHLFNTSIEFIENAEGEVSLGTSSFFCPENSFSLDLILLNSLKQENFDGRFSFFYWIKQNYSVFFFFFIEVNIKIVVYTIFLFQ